ncbi:5-formyltetrahydrofolate cyclo-ligase [Deinococcus sp.]|uniref:5-formyltetrahydrofolate cyclo-ligase n=1 Tax=Deinococcus sp. TaxID=47478 RepID=UPI0025C71676|nr:5-formyltetrahydrofolate cyclo-ligase [Deinococcus sp.]
MARAELPPPPRPPQTAGACREAVWNALERTRLCSFPLPPHGHCPNFKGARDAARQLLAHPRLAALDSLIVGPERALLPLRKLALESGKVLYVPHQKKAGWYWRLTDPAGASLSKMSAVGEPRLIPEGARAVVLACVGVDRQGGRLGKGYSWGARGLGLSLPEFTLAHPLMLRDQLPCPPDSRVSLIATPQEVLEVCVAQAE